jgi:hypothetical protein
MKTRTFTIDSALPSAVLRAPAKHGLAIATLVLGGGCFGWPAVPTDRPDPVIRKLADGKVLSLELNLKDQPGLCPGHEGKLYAKGMVEWPGQKPVARFIGNDVDSFAPSSFKVQGPLIKGDAEAHLHPSGDVLASIETGFEMRVDYTIDSRFSWTKVVRPEYSCFGSYSVAGAQGADGYSGQGGNNGDIGQSGTPGDHGQPGGRGNDGGRITALVTVVATPFYPKLYAVLVNDTFYLAPADQELWFVATGGPGGVGGSGGQGGAGGWQEWEEKQTYEDGQEVTKKFGKGPAGNGANGGNASYGGQGGNGGTIDVTYDTKFPELKGWIKGDVRPGAGGPPGEPGAGGDGGGTEAEVNPAQGNPGNPGNPSNEGGPGREGRFNLRGGNVSSRFNMRGLAIFGTSAAQAITTKGAQEPMTNSNGGGGRAMPRSTTPPLPAPLPPRRPRGGKR